MTFPGNGNPVSGQILVNTQGAFVIQVANVSPNTKYYVLVSPDDYAKANNIAGSYLLGVNFLDSPIVLQTVASDSLSSTDGTDVMTLQSTQAQLIDFVLSADSSDPAVNVTVRMTIYDASGVAVSMLDAMDGQT